MSRIRRFSPKQREVMDWWKRDYDAVICDGAVRSGKTLCMGVAFLLWAMSGFHGQQFALCGQTIGALRRNLLHEVLEEARGMGMRCEERRSDNSVTMHWGGRSNRFLLFGGRNEGSAALIQGMTLAGLLLDEAALMPRSFVEQACARCSVPGSRLWFNCNPEGPEHWFYREWILKAEERKALYLHFTMEDNPSLAESVRQRYRRLYTGVFYRRFILGEWAGAMQDARSGAVRDFVAVGDVDIRVIGADSPILESEVPVRQILEQLVAKTGIPPFMLGLNWSSTERMSAQQADLLTTEITAIRRTLTPVLERICRMWLRMRGEDRPFAVVWDDINLQDEVEEARAELYREQARKLRIANDREEKGE